MVRAMQRCARTCTVYVISVTHKLCVHENQTYSVASRLFFGQCTQSNIYEIYVLGHFDSAFRSKKKPFDNQNVYSFLFTFNLFTVSDRKDRNTSARNRIRMFRQPMPNMPVARSGKTIGQHCNLFWYTLAVQCIYTVMLGIALYVQCVYIHSPQL